jgi:hypothetical protein
MFRPDGDNGKPGDTAIKDILSPFASDRSAVSDCCKLADSDIAPHRAMLIYGFYDRRKPVLDHDRRLRDAGEDSRHPRPAPARVDRPAGPSGSPDWRRIHLGGDSTAIVTLLWRL